MGGILDKLDEWLRGLLADGIKGNLTGMFDSVNTEVGEIAGQVGMTPQAWNGGVFSMIQNLSETVIVPIAGVILTFVMCYELIQLVTERNNLHDIDTWMFFKWVFKTFCAVLIVTNTRNIVMGNLAGKLSDERYKKMANRYENEQAEISEKIKKIRSELDRLNSQSMSTDMFISTIRQYTRAKKLTPRMVNELIERIEVHQSEKIDGEWVQKLTIYYNCIGALFIPETEKLPVPNVTMNTRRGVYVTYEPAQNE